MNAVDALNHSFGLEMTACLSLSRLHSASARKSWVSPQAQTTVECNLLYNSLRLSSVLSVEAGWRQAVEAPGPTPSLALGEAEPLPLPCESTVASSVRPQASAYADADQPGPVSPIWCTAESTGEARTPASAARQEGDFSFTSCSPAQPREGGSTPGLQQRQESSRLVTPVETKRDEMIVRCPQDGSKKDTPIHPSRQ